MDIFTAFGRLFGIVLDAARAPAEQHAQIIADGLAREKEAVQAVLDYYSRTRTKLDDVDRYITEAEHKATLASHVAEHQAAVLEVVERDKKIALLEAEIAKLRTS